MSKKVVFHTSQKKNAVSFFFFFPTTEENPLAASYVINRQKQEMLEKFCNFFIQISHEKNRIPVKEIGNEELKCRTIYICI